MITKMLHQVKNMKHDMDDILVHTAIWTEHEAILRELFNRIKKAGLTICEDKLDSIQDAPAPVTKKQV